MPPDDGNLLLGSLGNHAVAINWLELMKWKQGQQALVWVHHELWVVDPMFLIVWGQWSDYIIDACHCYQTGASVASGDTDLVVSMIEAGSLNGNLQAI